MMIDLSLRVQRPGFTLQADLAVPAGVTALFGPSGAGKSTLLRAIAGLERAEGRLCLDGQDMQGRPPEARGLGVVFQDSRLFPHLSVRDNLLFGAPDASGLARISTLLGLDALLQRMPGTLSGGEARRVAIGRAVLRKPRLLLLDEPLTGLDAPRRGQILDHLETLVAETGLSVLMVSHSVDEVLRLADHLVLMQAGRVAASGPVAASLMDPALHGAMGEVQSLLSGEVVAHTGGMAAVETGAGRLWMPAPARSRLGEALRFTVAARDVTIATDHPSGLSTRSILPICIDELYPGPPVLLRCRIGTQALLAEVTMSAVQELGLRPGSKAFALIKASALLRGVEAARPPKVL